jgi:hypothetical protein
MFLIISMFFDREIAQDVAKEEMSVVDKELKLRALLAVADQVEL